MPRQNFIYMFMCILCRKNHIIVKLRIVYSRTIPFPGLCLTPLCDLTQITFMQVLHTGSNSRRWEPMHKPFYFWRAALWVKVCLGRFRMGSWGNLGNLWILGFSGRVRVQVKVVPLILVPPFNVNQFLFYFLSSFFSC